MADKAHTEIDKRLADMENRLSEIYRDATNGIEQKAREYFARFEALDEKKRQMLNEGKITEDEYLTWRKNKMLYGKRFAEMKRQIAAQWYDVNNVALSYINGEIPEVYVTGYNAIESDIDGIGGYSFTTVNADAVRELATAEKIMLPYKKLDPTKDIPWNVKSVNTAVLQGILQGESIPKIAARVAANTCSSNMTSAIRNARTMVTSAENLGRMDSYKRAQDDGIVLKREWIAANDRRTRHWHSDLDGKIKDIDEPFENVIRLSKTKYLPDRIMYPGDPNAHPANVYNCRCTIAAKVIGFEKVQMQKAVAKSEYNAETIDHQYRETEAMNEYDYFSSEQEKFRLDSIRAMAGYDDMEAMKALDALCGTSAEYRGIGDNVPGGWFSGADTKIRLATDGEFFNKARTIDAYIERSPKYKGSIYRGLSLDDDTISSFTVGGIFKENGNLSSWTSDRSVASMFAEGRSEELEKKPVIFRTKDPKHGTPASHLSIFGSEESEVLVSNMKDSEYIIEAVTEENGIVIVDMILKGG